MTNDSKPYPGYRGLVKGATGTVSSSPLVKKLIGSPYTVIKRPR